MINTITDIITMFQEPVHLLQQNVDVELVRDHCLYISVLDSIYRVGPSPTPLQLIALLIPPESRPVVSPDKMVGTSSEWYSTSCE